MKVVNITRIAKKCLQAQRTELMCIAFSLKWYGSSSRPKPFKYIACQELLRREYSKIVE